MNTREDCKKETREDLIKLTLLNGTGYVFSVDDYMRLRKEHRILGNMVGDGDGRRGLKGSAHVLPAELNQWETQLLVDEGLAVLVSKNNSLTQEPTTEDIIQYNEVQKARMTVKESTFKDSKLLAVRANMPKILEGKRKKLLKMGVPESDIELDSATVLKEISDKVVFDRENVELPMSVEHLMPHIAKIVKLPLERSLKYRVFHEFWKREKYVTGGDIFGADLVIYPGDPLLYHSSHIIILLPDAKVEPLDLIAKTRLAVTVNKICVFAYFAVRDDDNLDEEDDNQPAIHYQTVFWEGDTDKAKANKYQRFHIQTTKDESAGNFQDSQSMNEMISAKNKSINLMNAESELLSIQRSVKQQQPSTSNNLATLSADAQEHKHKNCIQRLELQEPMLTDLSEPKSVILKDVNQQTSTAKELKQANPSTLKDFVENFLTVFKELGELRPFSQVFEDYQGKQNFKIAEEKELEQFLEKELMKKIFSASKLNSSQGLEEEVPKTCDELIQQIELSLEELRLEAQKGPQQPNSYLWKHLERLNPSVVEKLYQQRILALNQLYQHHESANDSSNLKEHPTLKSWEEVAELIANTWTLHSTQTNLIMWRDLRGTHSSWVEYSRQRERRNIGKNRRKPQLKEWWRSQPRDEVKHEHMHKSKIWIKDLTTLPDSKQAVDESSKFQNTCILQTKWPQQKELKRAETLSTACCSTHKHSGQTGPTTTKSSAQTMWPKQRDANVRTTKYLTEFHSRKTSQQKGSKTTKNSELNQNITKSVYPQKSWRNTKTTDQNLLDTAVDLKGGPSTSNDSAKVVLARKLKGPQSTLPQISKSLMAENNSKRGENLNKKEAQTLAGLQETPSSKKPKKK